MLLNMACLSLADRRAHGSRRMSSALLRSMLIPADEHVFMAADFSAIEARVLAWLAGQSDLVQAFSRNEDVYQTTADELGGSRQHGKAIILGCGFGMGWKKFLEMGMSAYGLTDLNERKARDFIDFYRNRYKRIPVFWNEMNTVLYTAVDRRGQQCRHEATGITAVQRGRFLWVILPSKRPLCYHAPRIVDRDTPWGEEKSTIQVHTVSSYSRKWEPEYLYGGRIVENIVQAVARDIMAEAMVRVEKAGYPVVLTVHDEVVTEPHKTSGSLSEFLELMSVAPEWAGNCPINVDGYRAYRYRKG